MAFVALCEGYLRIKPHFELWKYFFTVELQKKKERKKPDLAVLMGCASIHLRGNQSSEYMYITLLKSSKGWNKLWFYLRNAAAAPLPIFTGRLSEEAPDVWRYGPVAKERKRLDDLLKAIMTLKGHGLHGTGVVGAYHVRRLAPLMVLALLMYKMKLDSAPEGMVMVAGEALNVGKTAQRIKEAMECLADPSVDLAPVYPVLGHPVMRPDVGFVELVSLL